MGTYNSAVITNGGQSMIAQAVAGASLEFTVIKTSNYAYPAGTNLATLTTINGIKQSKDITGAAVYNSRVIKISAAVDNTGISTAYTINTIGIYAKVGSSAESLFAVVTASAADTMPAYDSKPYSYIYEINLTMQNAANVTVAVNAAGLVNVVDLNAAKVEIRGEIADLRSAITPLILTEPMLEWTLRKNVDSSGKVTNTPYMALTNMFACTGGDKIHRSTPDTDGNKGLIGYVNQYVNGVWKSRTAINYNDTLTLDADVNGVRLAFGRTTASGVEIAQKDIDTYFKMGIYRRLVPAAEYIEDLEAGYQYRGNMSPLGITSFGDCDKNGAYAFSAEYVSSIIDAPKDLSSAGILYTMTGPIQRQVIIGRTDIYYRSGLTGDWRRVSKNAIEYRGVISKEVAGDNTSFSDFNEANTYYGFRANYKEICEDWPEEAGRWSGNLINLAGQYRDTSVKQYLIFHTGIFVRTGLYEETETGSGIYVWNFGEWDKLGETEIAPYYWENAIFDVCNAVNETKVTIAGTTYPVNSGLQGDRFVFITDTHWTYGAQNSPGIIYEIMRSTGHMKVFHGGDIVDGSLSNGYSIDRTPAENRAELLMKIRYYKRLLSRTKRELDSYEPMFCTVGNHEYMNPDRETQKKDAPEIWAFTKDYELTEDEAYKFAATSMGEKIAVRNSVGDYYFDNISQKIRYFFLGCDASGYMHSETHGWLNSCLSAMPEGYMAVIISHIGLYRNSDTGETRMLATFSGSNYYETYADYKEGEHKGEIKIWDVVDGVGKVLDNHYDKIAFVLSGHIHIDLEHRTINNVLIISTATDAWRKTRIDEAKDGETKGGGYNNMIPDTTSEHCFDVVSFDRVSQVVVLVRVGAKTITQGSWVDLLGGGKGYARAYTFRTH